MRRNPLGTPPRANGGAMACPPLHDLGLPLVKLQATVRAATQTPTQPATIAVSYPSPGTK